MEHLENFLELRGRNAAGSIRSIKNLATEFVSNPQFISGFDFLKPQTSILVGQVQSGKTGHYLGIAAAVADKEPERLPIFILLTQRLIALQQQTYMDAKQLLTTFDVFDENQEMEFRYSLNYPKPKMIVLKKDPTPLNKWIEILNDRSILGGRSLFIIDDEADATGLNTKINDDDQSEMNRLIELLVTTHNAYLLQVTATPHAIFLQNPDSIFRPKSHLYFPPGADYLGGNFFYPIDQAENSLEPYVFQPTEDNELAALQDSENNELPPGLKESIFTFLLTAAYRIGFERDRQCNFLLHPSAKTVDHNLIYKKVDRYIRDVQNSLHADSILEGFQKSYSNLKATKPQLPPFPDLIREVSRTAIKVVIMNSAPGNTSRELPNTGANIFIGGNVLSRGIVIPRLQTIYYCRTAQRLTIDTYWQHSRAFGYDRDPALVRLYMPPRLYSSFVQMSDSIFQLFDILQSAKTEEIQVTTPRGLAPTRSTVVEDLAGDCIIGGAHHFPVNPNQNNVRDLDNLLREYDENESYFLINSAFAVELLQACREDELGQIPSNQFEHSLRNISRNNEVVLIVRRGRSITAGTGTLLSPNDRKLGSQFVNDSVLILYRVEGEKEKGWRGDPFWIPNVKLPGRKVIYFKE
jgi:Z1 domain